MGLLRAAAVSLVAVALGPVGVALAETSAITIESPSNGSVANNQTPSFSGATNDFLDEVTLNIYAGPTVGPAPLQTLKTPLPPVNGTWSAGPSEPLPDGTYTAQAVQTNLAMETGTSEPVTFTVRTTSPTVTLNAPTSLSNDTTPAFTGTANETTPVTIQIYAGAKGQGPVVSSATATGTGSDWSSDEASPALPSGEYTAVATEESSLAYPSGVSEPQTFRVDTEPPTVILNAPEPRSNDTTPTFTGQASETTPVTIQIYAGAKAQGPVVSSATATGTGSDWSSDEASPALPSGEYTAVASQESSLGNPTGTSESRTFEVDTASPTVTLNAQESPSNNTTPTFSGQASESAPVTIQIYAGPRVEGPVVSMAAATGNGGEWSSGHASPALASGQYTAVATQKSLLGNPTGSSEPRTFEVDTASPMVTLNDVTSPSNNTTPSFAGTASDTTPVVVHIYNAETSEVSNVTASPAGGKWTSGKISPAVPSGSYTAVASQASSLGNSPGSSAPVAFTVDTEPPTVTLNSPALRSNNTTPSFTGTASDTTTVTIEIFAGAKAKGTAVSSATATPLGGDWSSSSAGPSLGNGEYTAVAIQESSLGNPVGTSEPRSFEVDTASPTVTLNPPKSPSNNTTPAFTGTASESALVTIEIYAGATAKGSPISSATATAMGGAWSSASASPALPDGQYTAVATQESLFENPAGKSEAQTFTVDTEPPTVTLNAPKSPSNNTSPTFTGTGSEATPVTIQIYAGAKAEGPVVSSAMATGNGAGWSSDGASPALSTGEYTAVASQASSLGNPTGTSESRTFEVDTASPTVTLNAPKSPSNNTAPTFTGTASDTTPVTVRIFDEASSEVSSATVTPTSGKWTSGQASPALSSGEHVYTAVATQESSLGNPAGASQRVTFTVDTTAPKVTLNAPVSRSSDTTPSFTGTASDSTQVVVDIYPYEKEPPPNRSPIARAVATPSGGGWSSEHASPPLKPTNGRARYTAVATQESSLGNPIGTSAPQTFTVDTAAPTVTLNAPSARSNDTTPSFGGTTNEATNVVLHIYDADDHEVSSATAPPTIGAWTSGAASPALPDGQYTVKATQESAVGNDIGETPSFPFSVDTVPPRLTLSYEPDGSSSVVVNGSAGTEEEHALPGVDVQLFSGSSIAPGQTPLVVNTVNVVGKAWSATFAGLSPGSYTVRAEQSDDVGNRGMSNTASFAIGSEATSAAVQPPTAPVASFAVFPSAPHTGEPVSLVSSSTDSASPITAFAWDLAGTGAFAPGGKAIGTSFSTPGDHLLRLRVTDANGLSSVAAETIRVTSLPLPLMQPFPTVRILTTVTRAGVRLRLLTVQAPAGARITVKCAGRGCPVRSQRRMAASSRAQAASVEFRKFERLLPAGVVLEVRVFKPGETGKYTRFAIRRDRLPTRLDTCLGPVGGKPIVCPSSQ